MCSDLDSSIEVNKNLTEFFEYIWGETEGFVYLPTLNRKTDEWKKVFFQWPLHKNHIVKHVLSGSARGLDVYYGPALFKEATKPTKENVLGTHVLWAEFDGTAPQFEENESGNAAPLSGEAASGAHSAVPAPSLRVQSSEDGHEHVYWKLDEFCKDIKWFEDRNRSITYSFRADTSGWDATQILRPPYTSNYKYPTGMPVTIINKNTNEYPSAQFEPLKPPPQLVTEAIDIGELPKIENVIAKYRWDDEHFKMFMDPKIPEGDRSSALMRLGYFCIETGMTNVEAYAVLYNADERWGKYKGRNDQKRRLVDIIDRARQKHPNPLSDLTFRGLQGTPVEQGKPLIYGFKDFLASEIQVEWVIEDLLEEGGYGMFASMPGVGKTQASIQLGMCVALGIPFLGWNVPKPRKVVVFSLEMSHVALKRFMVTIAEGYTEEQHALLQENFILIPLGESIPIERPEAMKFIESILDEIQPEGIIIDSVIKLTTGGDLSDKAAAMLNEKFAHLRSRYKDAFIWLIHHNRKASDNNKKPVDLSDVYGNVFLTSDMTSVIILWRELSSPSKIEFIPVKQRLSEMRLPFTATRTAHLTFELNNSADMELLKDDGANGSSNTDNFLGL